MSHQPIHVKKTRMESEEDALAIMGEALAALSMEVISDATGANRVGMIYDGEKVVHIREGGGQAQLNGHTETVDDVIEVESESDNRRLSSKNIEGYSEVHDAKALPENGDEDRLIKELEDAL